MMARSEELTEDFFTSVETPLAVLSPDGTVTRANSALRRAVRTPDVLEGAPFVSNLRAGDRERVSRALASVGAGASVTFEACLGAPADEATGRVFRFQATRLPTCLHVVGIAAPAARADDALKLALFDRVLESAPVAFTAMDRDGIYTMWEGKAVGRLGTKPGEMVGKSALEVFKDSEVFPIVLRALAGEAVTAPITVDGGIHAEIWQLPAFDDEGKPNGSYGFAIDVTAQRVAENELREKLAVIEQQNATLKMFSRVLESAPVVLWSIDSQGVYTLSEGKGLELVGFRPGESVGLNALEMFQGHSELARALTQALGGEDTRIVASAAPGVYFETWCMPLRTRSGEVHGVMGLGIDATERVKGEQELREKLELIERQSATIRSLATPIIQVWDEVLCLPVIGTVDSARTADMMQGLLEAIVREQARYAIVDLTGVEVVDTSTADHLIQLFRAAKVLGVDGILCGIRPAVAQTVVALGLELGSVRTMRSLRDALKWCIRASSQARARAANGPAAQVNGEANGARTLAALGR